MVHLRQRPVFCNNANMSDLTAPHAFVFVKHNDQASLAQALRRVNVARRQPFAYRSLILTAPRLRWIGLLLGRGVTDHLLLRNLSGQLNTLAFELELGHFGFAYRLHEQGRTTSAFESNLMFYINNRLQLLAAREDVSLLDLAEPVERFVLRRYQEQHYLSSAGVTATEIPDDLQAQYAGDAARLRPVLKADVTDSFVSDLLAPGFNPERAFARLSMSLELPYIPSDDVLVSSSTGTPRQVTGFAIMDPATWQDTLPEGWQRLEISSSGST